MFECNALTIWRSFTRFEGVKARITWMCRDAFCVLKDCFTVVPKTIRLVWSSARILRLELDTMDPILLFSYPTSLSSSVSYSVFDSSNNAAKTTPTDALRVEKAGLVLRLDALTGFFYNLTPQKPLLRTLYHPFRTNLHPIAPQSNPSPGAGQLWAPSSFCLSFSPQRSPSTLFAVPGRGSS